jgi:uncharacterized membrane protein
MGVALPLAVSLVFEPQTWTVGLPAVAALLLAAEGAALGLRRHGGRAARPAGLAGQGRPRSRSTSWYILGAGVALGIAASLGWDNWAGHWTAVRKSLDNELPWYSRAAATATLPMLGIACVLAAAGFLRRLIGAFAGQAGLSAIPMGLLQAGVIGGLAALTAFWVPQGAIVAIGMASVAWALRSYGRTTSPIGAGARWLLVGLRVATLLLLTGWALRPALEYRHQLDVRTLVLFCADTSRSMQRRDEAPRGGAVAGLPGEPMRRIEALRAALARQQPALAALCRQADVELIPFAAAASPARKLGEKGNWAAEAIADANGEASALGDAINEVHDVYAGQKRKIAAVVLLSDGCNNTSDVLSPDKAAGLLAGRGIGLHTVGVGSEKVTGTTRTLTVRDLAAPDEVDAFNRFAVTAGVETVGLEGRRIKVTCAFGEEEAGTEEFAATEAQALRPVRFAHVPLHAGFHRATVSAEVIGPAVGDLAGLHRQSKLVHVGDREVRVLYIEGQFRYETKYVWQALSAARRFSIDRRVLLHPLGGKQPAALSEDLDDWLAYHAILLGDVAASHFTPRQIEIMKELVGKYGKGLAMIGGDRSFARGGWAGTALADVLPVDLAASAGQTEAPMQVRPTAAGLQHDLMRISESGLDPAGDWAKLEPLPGANVLGGIKPAAIVLAESPAGQPLIVAQPYGKGRALAIAFDTTWKWVLSKRDTAELQRRFWRQAALFLAAPRGNVWIVTDRANYDLRRLRSGAESQTYRAGVEDAHGHPLPDAPIRVTLTDPSGKETRADPARPDEKKGEPFHKGRLAPPAGPGTYTLKIAASVQEKELTAEYKYEVTVQDLESLEVLANHNLLRQMADIGRGRFVTLDKLGDLLADLRVSAQPEKRDVPMQIRIAAEEPWPWLAAGALLTLMCAEWAARKRKGLV